MEGGRWGGVSGDVAEDNDVETRGRARLLSAFTIATASSRAWVNRQSEGTQRGQHELMF